MLVRDLHTTRNVKMWDRCIEDSDPFDAKLENVFLVEFSASK
jgi:hypothetical protein